MGPIEVRPLRAGETDAALGRWTAHWERHGFGLLAVEHRGTGALVARGGPQFHRVWPDDPEVGWAVDPDDGTTAEFRVHTIETYANADFPAKKVYGKQGRSQLNLVTCGGAYDSSRGGYQANVVVNARRV